MNWVDESKYCFYHSIINYDNVTKNIRDILISELLKHKQLVFRDFIVPSGLHCVSSQIFDDLIINIRTFLNDNKDKKFVFSGLYYSLSLEYDSFKINVTNYLIDFRLHK